MNRRVVVTATGMVTPIGNNVADTMAAAASGKTGFQHNEALVETMWADEIGSSTLLAAPQDFDVSEYMAPKEARRTDPFIVYAIAASQQAWNHRGFPERMSDDDGDRFGTLVGVGFNGVGHILDVQDLLISRGPRRVSPFFIPAVIGNLSAGHVGMRFNLRGPNWTPAATGASGSIAIGESMIHIRDGRCDRMLAGGAEASRHGMLIRAMQKADLWTSESSPEHPVRAFDKTRTGTVIGEGAGALILEERELAQKQGAHIICELAGYGSQQATSLTWNPSPEIMVKTIQMALEDAGLSPEDIDYVNPNGSGTQEGDEAEAKAIETVFGAHTKNLMVSSTKSLMGHLVGAAGAVEAIICAKAIETGTIPVSAGLHEPAYNLPFVTASSKTKPVRASLSMNFGVGGCHTALVLKAA